MRRYGLSLVSERIEPTGVGIYGIHLARALGPMLASDERLVVFRHERFPRPSEHERVEDVPLAFPAGRTILRRAAEQLLLPLAARRGIDLLHVANYVTPEAWRGRTVLALMDDRLGRRPLRRAIFGRSVRRADRLLAISSWSADRCAATFGVARERITVTPLGVDRDAIGAIAPSDRAAVLARLAIQGPCVVFVGECEPQKNVPRLVEAFAKIEARAATLVIAGGRGSEYEKVRARVAELGLEPRVRFPGYLERKELLALIGAATLLALPSFEEGFGLPVAEAFASGTPALTSRRGALAETAADAALFVEPEDTAAIAAAIDRLLGDEKLRADLAARGRARAAELTWERTAERTLEVYRSLAPRA